MVIKTESEYQEASARLHSLYIKHPDADNAMEVLELLNEIDTYLDTPYNNFAAKKCIEIYLDNLKKIHKQCNTCEAYTTYGNGMGLCSSVNTKQVYTMKRKDSWCESCKYYEYKNRDEDMGGCVLSGRWAFIGDPTIECDCWSPSLWYMEIMR